MHFNFHITTELELEEAALCELQVSYLGVFVNSGLGAKNEKRLQSDQCLFLSKSHMRTPLNPVKPNLESQCLISLPHRKQSIKAPPTLTPLASIPEPSQRKSLLLNM